MKSIFYSVTLIILFSLSACKNRKDSLNNNGGEFPSSILVENFDAYQNSAETTINSVTIEKNIMIISVSYSGGCEKHEFELIGSKMIQKSMPPKRGIMLFHNNNSDQCRSIVEEELRFDITNLAHENKEIILMLDGFSPDLSYTLAQ